MATSDCIQILIRFTYQNLLIYPVWYGRFTITRKRCYDAGIILVSSPYINIISMLYFVF